MAHPGYTIKQLLAAHAAAKTWAPDADFMGVDWCTVLTAREWLRWFRDCLQAKIFRDLPTTRKWTHEYQQEMYLSAQVVNSRQFRSAWFCQRFLKVFGHECRCSE